MNKYSRHSTLRAFVWRSLPLLVFLSSTWGCARDESSSTAEAPQNQGRLQVELTDGPLEDSRIEGVYLTVDHVSLDGEVVAELSQRRTIDILKYSAGRTLRLGSEVSLDEGIYENLELALDVQVDATGEAPGCYVLLKDGTKVDLARPDQGEFRIPLSRSVRIERLGKTRLVADFDVRKAIERGDTDRPYRFRTNAASDATRVVDVAEAGSIGGRINFTAVDPQAVFVAYLYQDGTYVRSIALAEDFAAAHQHARIRQGDFTFGFVPAGKYELVVARYGDAAGTGRAELLGTFVTDAEIGEESRSLFVSAQTEVRLDIQLGEFLTL